MTIPGDLDPSLRRDVAHIDELAALALDLRCTWNHAADALWRGLDPELWDATHSPWVVLQAVSRKRLANALADRRFRALLDEQIAASRESVESAGWFRARYPDIELSPVAYFCMEFMLSESLPIYSGGLGNVAGDQLKAASDLAIPVIGVGLLYQRGYFRQVIDRDGAQQAFYPYNPPGQLPISPLRTPDGEWLRIEIALPGYTLWLRAWEARVGRTRLFLLDTNDPANYPPHRAIAGELYGGPPEMRLQQEIALGIGGWRLLEALNLRPEVCHLNEGHAALVVLERARAFMREKSVPFDVALTATRAGNLFTTHTPVAAGFDRFAPDLVRQYLSAYALKELGLSFDQLIALGRGGGGDTTEPFNMAHLALRGSGVVNGVSRLHAKVSRRIFAPLFPRWPEAEIPVASVTNGVHVPSWDSAQSDDLWTEACSKERWRGTLEGLEHLIDCVPDAKLWRMRNGARAALIDYARERFARQLESSAADVGEIERARKVLDPRTLTLGFARRFATYKRPTLLLHDPDRLLRILTSADRPVQLIVAGKAHPADEAGKALIVEWTRFMQRPDARGHVIFLADYDVLLTERLVQGVDVWINTPRRPWEACGTSGMKTLVNGGLNLSELDGWWAEAYTPELGWAVGDGREHGDDLAWDATEADALYTLLEREIVPTFYDRAADGIPAAWVARVRSSMARLTPRFSSNRSVREYLTDYYLPAALAYRTRVANDASLAREIVAWQRELACHWDKVALRNVRVASTGDRHSFEVDVELGGLNPDAVHVELYAEGSNDGPPVRFALAVDKSIAADHSVNRYHGEVPAARPASDYTPRVIPRHRAAAIPLEAPWIRWP